MSPQLIKMPQLPQGDQKFFLHIAKKPAKCCKPSCGLVSWGFLVVDYFRLIAPDIQANRFCYGRWTHVLTHSHQLSLGEKCVAHCSKGHSKVWNPNPTSQCSKPNLPILTFHKKVTFLSLFKVKVLFLIF